MAQGDIREVDFSQLGKRPDIVIGGPPCQDFSQANTKKDDERPGLNGGRGKLYIEFVRALMFLQPKMFVFENVPGLKSANGGAAYEIIKSDLEHLEDKRLESFKNDDMKRLPEHKIEGYELLFDNIVNAPDLGVSQTRRRLIIIGLRKDIKTQLGQQTVEKLRQNIKTTLSGEGSLLRRYPLTVMEIFEGKTLAELGEKYKQIMSCYNTLADSYADSSSNEGCLTLASGCLG